MDVHERLLAKRFAKQEWDKSVGVTGGDGISGIPEVDSASGRVIDWGTPQGWEQFKAAYGFYPFGMQGGAMVRPSNASEAPDWAQRLMGGRTPMVR